MKRFFKILFVLMPFVFLSCDFLDSLYDDAFEKILDDIYNAEEEETYTKATVTVRKLEKIETIKEESFKTIYGIGDEFSPAGLTVKSLYDNGDELDVTHLVNYEGFDSSVENESVKVTVSFSENGITVSDTIEVSVFKNYTKPTAVILNHEELEIGLGNYNVLEVTFEPPETSFKKVVWTSSDPSIATVDSKGVVTALKEGFVTITATAVDGVDVKASCEVEAKYYYPEDIILTEYTEPLEATRTIELSAHVLPENAKQSVMWSSSDVSIASVDENGVVTAKKTGEIRISATATDKTKKGTVLEKSFNLTIFKYDAEKITVDKKELNILLNTNGTITAIVEPANTTFNGYGWTSSDESVATVTMNGVINAHKVGKTTITATCVDNSDIKDTCEVTVFKYDVESISIDKTSLSLFVDATETLTVTEILPSNATFKGYTWQSSNTNVATVSSAGVVTAVNAGEAEIIAVSDDNPDIKAVCSVTVTQIDALEPQDYQIGDIILKDGTYVSYTTITAEQKAKAVAVIFGYRNEYALGVALDRSTSLAWCTSSAPGYSINFSELTSNYEYTYDDNGNRTYTFTGNTNGSDDWAYICSLDSTGTGSPATYYPAWNYIINYGTNKKLKGFYKENWYMPTISELYKLYNNFSLINTIIISLGGIKYFTPNNNYDVYFWTPNVRIGYSNKYIKGIHFSNYMDLMSTGEYVFDCMKDQNLCWGVPVKAFPCTTVHYDDYVTNSISVSYPSYSDSSINVKAEADSEGNYTFNVYGGTGSYYVSEPTQQNFTMMRDIKDGLVAGVTSYYVQDVEGLSKLAEIVNGGNSLAGYIITQAADIIINQNLLSNDLLEPDEGANCTPNPNLVNLDSIGNRNKKFAGTYNGNNKIISGLYIYQSHQGLGLIGGTAEGAVIKNVALLDTCIINSNVSAEADGSDDDRFGGLIGFVDGTTTVENCIVETVVGSSMAKARGGAYEWSGGLIGYCNSNITVTNCIVLARLYASSSNIICGRERYTLTQSNVVAYDASSQLAEGKTAIQLALAQRGITAVSGGSTGSSSGLTTVQPTYRWFVDSTLLDSSLASESGTTLTLSRAYLATLTAGNHTITVLQQMPDGNFYDACCYINITYGTESYFTPTGNSIAVVLPVYSTSTLSINVTKNSSSYTLTAQDENRVYTKYSWLLDSTVLEQNGTVLEISSEQIEALSIGAHQITLVAQTADGEFFDAQCYIRKNGD